MSQYTYNDYNSKNHSPDSSEGSAVRPDEYKSEYIPIANNLIKEYLERDEYKYNINADKLYAQYAEKYKREGEKAMRDTVADASLLSGGYGNSYAVTAGVQAYQSYLDKLNDVVPELEEKAYERYADEGERMKDDIELFFDADESEYEKYRDSMKDYFADREFFEDNYRFREETDIELYLALYDYFLKNRELDIENQKLDDDYKIGMFKAYN